MRVLVSHLGLETQKTGVGHYAGELVRCLRALPGEHQVFEYRHAFLHRLRQRRRTGTGTPAAPGLPGNSLKVLVRNRFRSWKHTLVRCYAWLAYRSRHFDLYHEPNFIPLPCELPTVATVHDLSVVLHPEWHPPERVARFERYFRGSLERCRHLLTVSESARQEIIHTLGVPPERVTCVYNGVRPGLRRLPPAEVSEQLRQLGLPPEYLLYVGTIEPRKNVLRLLRAYCGLPAALRVRCPLLLVGGWGWRADDVAAFYHDEARHQGVRHLGYLPEERLPIVYNGARALLSPSLYEGFGLPPVEMLATGGAVIASRIGPHEETCGKVACLVEPEDIGGWHDALERILTDDGWREQLRAGAVEAARPFTWERCAADTLAVYRRTLGMRAAPAEQRGAA